MESDMGTDKVQSIPTPNENQLAESGYTYYEMVNTPLTAISVILNGLILLFILSSPRLRKQHNIFTFNMALIDLTSAVISLLGMYDSQPRPLYNASWNSCTAVSTLNILLVAIYRFVTVQVDPFGVNNLVTTPRCIVACILAWMTGFFPLYVELILSENRIGVPLSICILLLFILTGLSYTLLYTSVTRTGAGVNDLRLKENRQLLKTFAAIYVTSFSLWMPLCVYGLSNKLNTTWYRIGNLSYNTNLIANPVIYWVRSNEFKATVKTCVGYHHRSQVQAVHVIDAV
nr:uncharacterized protein LOC129254851 [Lytechinus pictus]